MAMSTSSSPENRRSRRFPLTSELKGSELSAYGISEPGHPELTGRMENISNGGLCLLTGRLLKPLQVVRCKLSLPGIPIAIPTLLQVRWVGKDPRTHRNRVGLQFLL